MNANERAQAAARKSGRDTYQHEVVDYWPACTVCGTTIRHRGITERWRSCGCPDVEWLCGMNGWKRRTTAPETVEHKLTDGGLCVVDGPHPRTDCTA